MATSHIVVYPFPNILASTCHAASMVTNLREILKNGST